MGRKEAGRWEGGEQTSWWPQKEEEREIWTKRSEMTGQRGKNDDRRVNPKMDRSELLEGKVGTLESPLGCPTMSPQSWISISTLLNQILQSTSSQVQSSVFSLLFEYFPSSIFTLSPPGHHHPLPLMWNSRVPPYCFMSSLLSLQAMLHTPTYPSVAPECSSDKFQTPHHELQGPLCSDTCLLPQPHSSLLLPVYLATLLSYKRLIHMSRLAHTASSAWNIFLLHTLSLGKLIIFQVSAYTTSPGSQSGVKISLMGSHNCWTSLCHRTDHIDWLIFK